MIGKKISAFLDFELTRRLESFVINALPQQSHRSDFNMMYIANIEIEEDDDGRFQESIECDDTFFLSITNDFGYIDFDIIKTIHIAGVIESEYEVVEYYPSADNIEMFSTYHENHPIPTDGGFMHIAICPFGVNKIEMINGDIIHVYGNGKVKVTAEQIGFKGYKQIPRIPKILGNDFFKILKLAIYSRYTEYSHRKYSLNIFSPTMRFTREPIEGQILINDDRLLFYNKAETIIDDETGNKFIVNSKDNSLSEAVFSTGQESLLYGIGRMVKVDRNGFIDLSTYGLDIGSEFSIHTNIVIDEYAKRGTILFDIGYGITESGYQTHHITLFLDKDGQLSFNCQYSDEYIGTGVFVSKGMEHTITFTIENQKYDDADQDEYMAFIHMNGKQVWPNEKMLSPTEKIYLWRAMEAYRTYTEVCLMLPAPDPINGGLDAKDVCAKKLLQESGFINYENLVDVYQLYLNRPRACKADLNNIVIGSEENTKIKKMFFGQDSQKDTYDEEYYIDGQFSEIAIFSPGLKKEEIEQIHLLNILRSETIKG